MRDICRAWPGVPLAAFWWLAVAAEVRADDRDIAPRLEACASCHGTQGRAAEETSAPSLAGKPSLHLYEQLRNFRDERRQSPVMQRLLAFLPDEYLREIATYYAAQPEPPRPSPRDTNPNVLAAATGP